MVGCISILCMSNHLDGGSASRTLQSHVHPIQPQHVQEYIEQGRADLTRVAAHPDGGEGQHTDQVVDARLEVLNLIYRFVHLTGPAERSMAKRLSCNCAKNSPDDYQRIGSHDINHDVSAKPSEIVCADHWIHRAFFV